MDNFTNHPKGNILLTNKQTAHSYCTKWWGFCMKFTFVIPWAPLSSVNKVSFPDETQNLLFSSGFSPVFTDNIGSYIMRG